MKPEKGMYIRTVDGISKVVEIKEGGEYIIDEFNNTYFISSIIGHPSFDLMYLIEPGDKVNNEKVVKVFNPLFLAIGELPYIITEDNKYEEWEIETIITKEQLKKSHSK